MNFWKRKNFTSLKITRSKLTKIRMQINNTKHLIISRMYKEACFKPEIPLQSDKCYQMWINPCQDVKESLTQINIMINKLARERSSTKIPLKGSIHSFLNVVFIEHISWEWFFFAIASNFLFHAPFLDKF